MLEIPVRHTFPSTSQQLPGLRLRGEESGGNKSLFGLWILSMDCTSRKGKSKGYPRTKGVWPFILLKKEKTAI